MKAPLPVVTPETAPFWHSGESGKLCIMCCDVCAHYIHPPLPICPLCGSRSVMAKAVSGRANLASFTINYQPWIPGLEVPFVIGLAEIEEQAGLRLTTNIVNASLESLKIGMALRVLFEKRDDVWLPLFEPDTSA